MPELMKLLRTKSMMRYFPPKGTAGLARSLVSGYNRVPFPPASTIPRTRSRIDFKPILSGQARGCAPTAPAVLTAFIQAQDGTRDETVVSGKRMGNRGAGMGGAAHNCETGQRPCPGDGGDFAAGGGARAGRPRARPGDRVSRRLPLRAHGSQDRRQVHAGT